MADDRKLEKTSVPGVFRRHAASCKRGRTCKCPYIVRWKERGRTRKQFFATFELAREHKGALDSGNVSRRPQSSETVASYYEHWLPNFRGRTSRGLEDSTRTEYEISFRRHILPYPIAHIRIRDLAAPDVRDWFKQLERRDVGPRTIQKAKATLSVMLASAAEDGDIPANPTTAVRYVPSEGARRKHPKRKPRALTPEDVEMILAVMPEQWQAFFNLLVQTGVRVSEALGLTWSNVHLADEPHILITEQIYKGRRKRLKTDASRGRVPLSPQMASWLAELRPDDPRSGDPVFASTTGTPLNYANVYHRVLQPALRCAGLDGQGIAFHAFRKACGSFLLHHGKTLKQVQGWLRHSQLTTTMDVYIQQVDDGLGGADVWSEILPSQRSGGGASDPLTIYGPPSGERARHSRPGATLGATADTEVAASGEVGGAKKRQQQAKSANARKQP